MMRACLLGLRGCEYFFSVLAKTVANSFVSLILASVYSLMLGHPGLVFRRRQTEVGRDSGHELLNTSELVESK